MFSNISYRKKEMKPIGLTHLSKEEDTIGLRRKEIIFSNFKGLLLVHLAMTRTVPFKGLAL